METIKCLHPVIIVNPIAKDLSHTFGCYLLVDGIKRSVTFLRNGEYTYAPFYDLRKQYNVKSIDCDRFYLTDGKDFCVPVFMSVPCGKCALCQSKKRDDWSARCVAETAVSKTLPVFFTLTYAPEHVRYNKVIRVMRSGHKVDYVMTLCKDDVQKFMHRLRKHLIRKCGWHIPLRYAIVGEYGPTTHRPHYHAIVWNFPDAKFLKCNATNPNVNDIQYIKASEAILHKCWDYSHEDVPFDFDYVGVRKIKRNGRRWRDTSKKGDAGSASKYVAKYVSKDCPVPIGADSMRMLCSNRGGGIGVPYLRQHITYYRNPANCQLLHVGNNSYTFPQLFRNWAFPSRSRIFKKEIREAVARAYTSINTINAVIRAIPTIVYDSLGNAMKSPYFDAFFQYCGFGFQIDEFNPRTFDFLDAFPYLSDFKNALPQYQRCELYTSLCGYSLDKLIKRIQDFSIDCDVLLSAIDELASDVEDCYTYLSDYFELIPEYHTQWSAKVAMSEYVDSTNRVSKLYDVAALNSVQEWHDKINMEKRTL